MACQVFFLHLSKKNRLSSGKEFLIFHTAYAFCIFSRHNQEIVSVIKQDIGYSVTCKFDQLIFSLLIFGSSDIYSEISGILRTFRDTYKFNFGKFLFHRIKKFSDNFFLFEIHHLSDSFSIDSTSSFILASHFPALCRVMLSPE